MTDSCNYAAIDLGSNSCRLLVCDAKGNHLFADNYGTKLAEGMGKDKLIRPMAFVRAEVTFAEIRKKLDEYQVDERNLRAVATAACRMAKNGEQLIKRIAEVSRINLEVIDGREEAELNLQGASEHVKGKSKYLIVWDLGGASTEVTLAENREIPKILRTISIPYGARNGAEDFALREYDKNKAQQLSAKIDEYLDEFMQDLTMPDRKDICFVATSSTPLRLVSMLAGKGKYSREEADGKIIKTSAMENLLTRLYKQSVEEMAQNPCIGESRAPIFVAACVIFARIVQRLQANDIMASLKSAKDAIITNLIERDKTNGESN